jgi:hypothetical protein
MAEARSYPSQLWRQQSASSYPGYAVVSSSVLPCFDISCCTGARKIVRADSRSMFRNEGTYTNILTTWMT